MINPDLNINPDVMKLADIILNSKSLVFFGGAGVSTESGIPDFRSSQGLYEKPNTYVYSPEYLLSLTCFKQNPEDFFHYYFNEMIHPTVQPNKAHYALSRLEELGYCNAIITQNIDGLHQAAGSKVVYELHGTIHKNICQSCYKEYSLDQLLNDRIKSQTKSKQNFIPTCSCSGIIKPDVILYEEALDENVITKAINALREADVLIVGGTSLRVYPAAGFLHYFKGEHLILMNREETSFDQRADLIFREPIGEVMAAVMLYINDSTKNKESTSTKK